MRSLQMQASTMTDEVAFSWNQDVTFAPDGLAGFGPPGPLPDVEWLSGRDIEIVADDDHTRDGPVQGDGDVIARLPLKIEMSPEPVALVRP